MLKTRFDETQDVMVLVGSRDDEWSAKCLDALSAQAKALLRQLHLPTVRDASQAVNTASSRVPAPTKRSPGVISQDLSQARSRCLTPT